MVKKIYTKGQYGGFDERTTEYQREYYGLSSDTKPAASLGDFFIEADTTKLFVYDGTTWNEWGAEEE